MSMLGSLLGGMVDTEKITFDTIQGALEDVAEELGCSHKELFIKISASILASGYANEIAMKR